LEKGVGGPVEATMETVPLGACRSGAVAHVDKLAFEADGIVGLGRTHSHPETKAGIASGLLKMTTAGLGKQAGAQQAHNHGLWDSVKAVPQITLAKAKILAGIAVVENAFRQPLLIDVVPPDYDAFKQSDTRLLEFSRRHGASLPFEQLDLLIVDQLGKNISGTGMDLNVIGKWRIDGGERKPDFRRIAVLSLTAASLGNGLGIGLADFTTERFMKEYDPYATYVNLLTATEPGAMNPREGPLPMALPSDRDAVEVALYSALPGPRPRVCRIESTERLDEFWGSEALLPEIRQNPKFSALQEPRPMKFDSAGNFKFQVGSAVF